MGQKQWEKNPFAFMLFLDLVFFNDSILSLQHKNHFFRQIFACQFTGFLPFFKLFL